MPSAEHAAVATSVFAPDAEHFCTLFDIHYLPMGLALHASLVDHAQPFHLWILCIDRAVEQALRTLDLPHVTLMPLATFETDALRAVRPERGIGEYCWTLTPHLPGWVFAVAPQVERVTYVDADLYFFAPPSRLLDEFVRSGKHVQITDHAYAPEYDTSAKYGRFCVQFMTFRATPAGRKVLDWWRERCIEWCFARLEDGRFGDQKYLDDWPQRFAADVHVLEQTDRTLAPWNVAHVARTRGRAEPVFFHFHSLRLFRPDRVRLFYTYRIGAAQMWIYARYRSALAAALETMRAAGIAPATLSLPREKLWWLRWPLWWAQGRLRHVSV